MIQQIFEIDEFQKIINKYTDTLLVFDFFTTWCGPCKKIAPEYEKISEKYSDCLFFKIDIEDCDDIVDEFNLPIEKFPTFLFYKNNELLEHIQSSDILNIENIIQKYNEDLFSNI